MYKIGTQLYATKKDELIELYINQRKSIRKISKELNIPKTTIESYLTKFQIQKRSRSEASKNRFKTEKIWCEGFSKSNNEKLRIISEKTSEAFRKMREEKIKVIELNHGMQIENLLKSLYCDRGMSQEKIAKLLNVDRRSIIKLMRINQIELRPNYQYISSLRGEKHSMYGKTWNKMFGREEANKRREIASKFFRELTIRRIQNKKFPFLDTKIEKIIAIGLRKRKIHFISQYRIGKFVCDFAIPSIRLVIECDGDYWHANPEFYDRSDLSKLDEIQKTKIKRDFAKEDYLTKNSWSIIRFFESEINRNSEECICKIENKINKIAFDQNENPR